ncbi:MAG: PIG-L family deacetylase [Lentisphaeria bacterium]|nr:PIG-L family deacetylase [Lentisphaeria bacterium]
MKLLSIHAHYNDFELSGLGSFLSFRKKHGPNCHIKAIICTNGEAGHNLMTRSETGLVRYREQEEAAKIGHFDFELLRYPNDEVPREGTLMADHLLCAALWKAIRDYKPDYLFCPGLINNPVLGIHPDHQVIAKSIRKIAYMIQVPLAYSLEYPNEQIEKVPIRLPVIINFVDTYQISHCECDLGIDISEVVDIVISASYCHKSQICEWLPWIGQHIDEPPKSLEDWKNIYLKRMKTIGRQMGYSKKQIIEGFILTSWGRIPKLKELLLDFPESLVFPHDLKLFKRKLDYFGAGQI